MASKTSFTSMLKKYMPYQLLLEEIIKRDYLLQKIEKDQNWKGGDMEVAFKGGAARSFKFGGLVAEGSITENKFVKGVVPRYKELWGAMVFNDTDLQEHGDMEQSFIKILPGQLEDFLQDAKEAISVSLLNGSHIDSYDSVSILSDLVNGVIAVDRPERFTVGQYIEFGAVGTLKGSGYVKSIDMENLTLTINSQIDLLGLAVDLSATGVINIVAGDKMFYEGGTVAANKFTSLSDQLLSLANGGDANIFGVPKLDYPHLQAAQFDGSGLNNTATFIQKLFDFQVETKTRGKGNPTEIIMSGKNFAIAAKQLEGSKQYISDPMKANPYGWSEITIGSARGNLKLVGINEMDNDKMYVMDWNSLKLHSNGFFERRTSPEGRQFYEVRSPTGFKYIVDIRFFGELVVSKPSHCGVVYNIPTV